MLSLDCNNVDIPADKNSSYMNLAVVEQVINRLFEMVVVM